MKNNKFILVNSLIAMLSLSACESISDQTQANTTIICNSAYLKEIKYKRDEVLENCKREAMKGIVEAQFNYGRSFVIGDNDETEADQKTMIHWVMLAAKQGYPPAQSFLANAYIYGRGVTKDPKQGFKWMKRAAKSKYTSTDAYWRKMSRCEVGRMYYEGLGTSKNYRKAAKWLKLEENHHCIIPQDYLLGRIYSEGGYDVAKNDIEAVKWLKSSKPNSYGAGKLLDTLYAEGRGLTDKEKKIIQTLKLAAQQGDAQSQFELGRRYYERDGLPKQDDKALDWFKRAAEQGHEGAQLILGERYYKWKNYKEAVKWLEPASKNNNIKVLSLLAQSQLNLDSMLDENSKGFEYLVKAADYGDFYSQLVLGSIYAGDLRSMPVLNLKFRITVTPNEVRAVKYLTMAAESEEGIYTKYMLGLRYITGDGVPKDMNKAAEILEDFASLDKTQFKRGGRLGYDKKRIENMQFVARALANGIMKEDINDTIYEFTHLYLNFGYMIDKLPLNEKRANIKKMRALFMTIIRDK